MASPRWDADERGHGVADARSSIPGINELAQLAAGDRWIAEEPERHLLPGLQERIAISGLRLEEHSIEDGGVFRVRLSSGARLSRREVRQSVWSIIGGAAELSTFVRESGTTETVTFEVVTGTPPGGRFATHGHTLRIEVSQPA